jgi:hypothetical protein
MRNMTPSAALPPPHGLLGSATSPPTPRRHASVTLTSLTLMVCCAAALTACGGSYEVIKEQPLTEDVRPPKGIVVLPVALMSHRGSAVGIALRSTDVANWLLDHTEVPLISVLDYKIFKPVDEVKIASADTDLVTAEGDERRDLTGWWAVTVLVTENRSTNVRNIVDTRKGKDGATISRKFGIEAVLRVEVTVRDAMRGGVKAQVVVVEDDDPDSSPIQGDPRPVLRRLVERALALTFEAALPGLTQPQRRIVRSRGLLPSVPALADLSFPDKPSYNEPFVDRPKAAQEAALVSIWDRVMPNLDVRATMRATRNPGVLMLEDRAPLKQYDVILEVSGRPVRDQVQLDRRLQACSPSCEARVRRRRNTIELILPWKSVPPPADEQ